MKIDFSEDNEFLSDWYAQEVPDCVLLCEYPSSNSQETVLQNRDRYIIHDPFPPPDPSLLKTLGPHHLMFGWGGSIPVASQVPPGEDLVSHWENLFLSGAKPDWREFDVTDAMSKYVVLFPHESIAANQQLVDPGTNYHLHSKEVIPCIDCPQPAVLNEASIPSVVKLSHGYAGLGNYFVHSQSDLQRMNQEVDQNWNNATLVATEIIRDVVGDYGVQFFLTKSGGVKWLGYTEQHFDSSRRWCGGQYESEKQIDMAGLFSPFIRATSNYLHSKGYFGVVGIDILKNAQGEMFLVDVNPRLTGITPFVLGARFLGRENRAREGLYAASCEFYGSPAELFEAVDQLDEVIIAVLSYFEKKAQGITLCHLGAYSNSPELNVEAIESLTSPR